MLPLGIANKFALLSLTRICENGKLRCAQRLGASFLYCSPNLGEQFFLGSVGNLGILENNHNSYISYKLLNFLNLLNFPNLPITFNSQFSILNSQFKKFSIFFAVLIIIGIFARFFPVG